MIALASRARVALSPLRGAVLPAAIVLAWWAVARLQLVNAELLPPPARVLATGREHLGQRAFWGAAAASLGRAFAGFSLAAAGGIAVGVLLGASRWAERLIAPTFHAWRQVAIFAWIPLLSAWFGAGDSCKIAFIAVASFAPVVFNTFVGVRALAPEHRELAAVLGLGRARFLLGVVVPSAAPQILVGLHLALVASWLAAIGAELFLEITPGLGALLAEGRALGRMDLVIGAILAVGSVGFCLNLAFGRVERRLLRWRPVHPRSDP